MSNIWPRVTAEIPKLKTYVKKKRVEYFNLNTF